MQNSHDLKRFRARHIDHKIRLSDGPKQNLLIGEVRTLMHETGIVCEYLARRIDVGFEFVGCFGIVTGNPDPDFLNVISRFLRAGNYSFTIA